jgi:hypothetical protein
MKTSIARHAHRSSCAIPRALGALLAAILAAAAPAAAQETPVDFKVAFIGDQGLGSDAEAVLTLIRSEGADAVIHQGDFDYRDDPAAWEAMIDGILGPDFPYFASVGNHDTSVFYGAGGYQEVLSDRMARLGIPFTGDLGVQSFHHFQGILVVLTAPGVFGAGDGDHDLFIRDVLAADDSIWKISSWHKNMTAMQVGGKGNETGWGVYEESRRGGAIVATGHEHSYSRTHLLSSMERQTVASREEPLVLRADDPGTSADEGTSFAFVSGLGGKSIRDQERDGDWWDGALFGVFNYGGDPRLAYFYFKDVDGNVPDEFLVESTLTGSPGDPPPPPPPAACDDGLDNDGDGNADHPADLGCDDVTDDSERSSAWECDDGLDNDRDGLADHPLDPDCESPTGTSESAPAPPDPDPPPPDPTPAACEDGVDNDGDGRIDYPEDKGCKSRDDAHEEHGKSWKRGRKKPR